MDMCFSITVIVFYCTRQLNWFAPFTTYEIKRRLFWWKISWKRRRPFDRDLRSRLCRSDYLSWMEYLKISSIISSSCAFCNFSVCYQTFIYWSQIFFFKFCFSGWTTYAFSFANFWKVRYRCVCVYFSFMFADAVFSVKSFVLLKRFIKLCRRRSSCLRFGNNIVL